MSDCIFDYLKWRGDLSFTAVPANEIDYAILAQIAYCPFEKLEKGFKGKTLGKINPLLYTEEKSDSSWEWQKKLRLLWKEIPNCPRYANLKLADFKSVFKPEEDTQFAVATFAIGTTAIVAYRGTDLSIVGWRENFRLGYESPVPAQSLAVEYLNKLPEKYTAVYLCGHSKGGNLAMYAASHCKKKARIKEIYNFDGPGLDDDTLQSKGWKQAEKKLKSFVPEASVVGMLLGYALNYTIVDADSISILQHNNFTWRLDGPHFKEAENLTTSSVLLSKAVHGLLREISVEERKVFILALFKILEASECTRSDEVLKMLVKNLPAIIKTGNNLSVEEKEILDKVQSVFIGYLTSGAKLRAELEIYKSRQKIKGLFKGKKEEKA